MVSDTHHKSLCFERFHLNDLLAVFLILSDCSLFVFHFALLLLNY